MIFYVTESSSIIFYPVITHFTMLKVFMFAEVSFTERLQTLKVLLYSNAKNEALSN